MLGVLVAGSFFQDRLQLSEGFEVFRPSGCPLHGDQLFKTQTPALNTEDLDRDAARLEILVGATTRNFSKEIEIANTGCKREVQTSLDCGGVPAEWQARRCSAQVWVIRGKRDDQPLDVLPCSPVDSIDIECEAGRTMHGCRRSTNQDELHTALGKSAQQGFEVSHGAARLPARPSSSANLWSSMRGWSRSSMGRLRVSRMSVRSTSRLYASTT